jgi:hypothetical protein
MTTSLNDISTASEMRSDTFNASDGSSLDRYGNRYE